MLCIRCGWIGEMATEGTRKYGKNIGFLGLFKEICIEYKVKGINEII